MLAQDHEVCFELSSAFCVMHAFRVQSLERAANQIFKVPPDDSSHEAEGSGGHGHTVLKQTSCVI